MFAVPRISEMKPMVLEHRERPLLLVVQDVEETALLMERILSRSGYCVALARHEQDAIDRARLESPDLVLISLGIEGDQLAATANRIREQSSISEDIAIVVVANAGIPEGAEIMLGNNIYFIRPDDFNQLRALLHRLAWSGPKR